MKTCRITLPIALLPHIIDLLNNADNNNISLSNKEINIAIVNVKKYMLSIESDITQTYERKTDQATNQLLSAISPLDKDLSTMNSEELENYWASVNNSI